MRVDLLHALENQDNRQPWGTVLERARRRFALADECGIDGIWVGEHHFDHIGIDQSPNPVMLLADLAGRTSRIRIGIAAVILPTWHPMRLAEDIAMLDQMTGGRLDVALSRGILQAEIVNLNPEADRANDALSKEIFAERLDFLRAAWTQDPLVFRSERFEVPRPETKWPGPAGRYTDGHGHATGLAVIPQPLQPGGPPLFSVTDTPGGFTAAAQQGLDVITWFPTRRVLDGLNSVYRAELQRLAAPRASDFRSCAILRGCLIAETDEQARALAAPEVRASFDFIKKVRGIKVWLDEGEDPEDPAIAGRDPFDLLIERDHLMVGSPDTVVEMMTRISEERGVSHWVLSPSLGEDDECVERTIRLLAEEVMPRVKQAVPA